MAPTLVLAETVGRVSTTFHSLSRNDQVRVEVFDDPKVAGVSCYVSHAVTGGVKGTVGLAEDPARMSIACRQTGPLRIVESIDDSKRGELVFQQKQNWIFKSMRVTRFLDKKRNTLVYLVWSTRLIEGSPFNNVTVVPLLDQLRSD